MLLKVSSSFKFIFEVSWMSFWQPYIWLENGHFIRLKLYIEQLTRTAHSPKVWFWPVNTKKKKKLKSPLWNLPHFDICMALILGEGILNTFIHFTFLYFCNCSVDKHCMDTYTYNGQFLAIFSTHFFKKKKKKGERKPHHKRFNKC